MYKQITGKEALVKIADSEPVFVAAKSSPAEFVELCPSFEWSVIDFISDNSSYLFAVKVEPMRKICESFAYTREISIDVSKFLHKRVRITVEEIEP